MNATFLPAARAAIPPPAAELREVEESMRALTCGDVVDITAQAARHHLDSGGGRTRALLGLQISKQLGLDKCTSIAIAASSELLHNASLIHDDIQDASPRRRDAQALWVRYGVEIALSTGDLFISAAYAALARLARRDVHLDALIGRTHEATRQAIRGQNEELRSDFASVTLAGYERIVAAKSGALLALPAELAFIAAGRSQWNSTVNHGARRLATAYQILDDIDDFAADVPASNAAAPQCLNLLAILQRQASSDSMIEAKRLASLRLAEAEQILMQLPDDCDRPFRAICARLRTRLERP